MRMMRSTTGAASGSKSAQRSALISGQPFQGPRQAPRLSQPSTVCPAYKKQSYYAFSEDLDTLDAVDDLNFGEYGTYAEPLYARPQQYSQGAYQARYNQRARVNLPYDSLDYDMDRENARDDAWDRPQEPRYINGKQILCNKQITAPVVRVIAGDGGKIMKGVMKIEEAWNLARSSGVDLLLLNSDATPPLCRLCDWSKYKYEIEKDQKKKAAKAVNIETKEVRLRPSTDVGDLATKVKSAQKFLDKGNKVKLVMKFEGRELQFKEQGKQVMLKFIEDLGASAKVDGNISFKTGTFTAMLVPSGKSVKDTGSGSPAPAAVEQTAASLPPAAPPAALPLPPVTPAQQQQQRLPMPPAPPAAAAPAARPPTPAAQPPLPPAPPMQRPMTPGVRPMAPAPLPMPARPAMSPSPGPAPLRPPMPGAPGPLPMPPRPMSAPPPPPMRQPVPAVSN